VADGAHTAGAAAALAEAIRTVAPDRGRLVLVLAAAADKPLRSLFGPLAALRPNVVLATHVHVAGSSRRSAAPADVADAWQQAEWDAIAPWEPRAELRRADGGLLDILPGALRFAGERGLVCVTGSLHAAFAAEAAARQKTKGPDGGRSLWVDWAASRRQELEQAAKTNE